MKKDLGERMFYFWLISFLLKLNQQLLVGFEIAEKFCEHSKLQGDLLCGFLA